MKRETRICSKIKILGDQICSDPDADEKSLCEPLERPYPGWGKTYGNKCGWYSIVCRIIGSCVEKGVQDPPVSEGCCFFFFFFVFIGMKEHNF